MSAKRGVEFLRAIAEHISVKAGGHDTITKVLRITGGGDGRCIGEFTVAKEHLNAGGGLHGGYTATVVDNVTTYALMSANSHPGVTVDLRVSYLTGAKEGDEIIVDANTLKFRVTGGGDGRCIGEFTVAKEHINAAGSLHGGYISTIIDHVTSYELMSANSHSGVSIDLRVSYVKNAVEGEDVIVEANTLTAGKNLAFTECVLKKKKDGSIIAKGGQTKFVDFKNEIKLD